MAPQGFMTSSGHRLVEEVHELAEGVLLGADRIHNELYIQEVSRRAQHLHEGQARSYDGTDYKKRKPGHQGSGFSR